MSKISLREVFQDLPPGEYDNVLDVLYKTPSGMFSEKEILAVNTPDLQLYCDSEQCNGVRLFEHNVFPGYHDYCEVEGGDTAYEHAYIEYICQNCKGNLKSFAIMIVRKHDDGTVDIIKTGEYPFYGPNIPSKLVSLIGSDRELFIKGVKCESQSLGIAAFSYYRRVIENQRDRIIDKVIDVLLKSGVDNEGFAILNGLKKQRQFKSSVDELKPYLPESLLIEGHNPLSLLHKTLSIGLHELSDEECLSHAHNIRIVLAELAVKLKFLLSDKNELKSAVNALSKLK